MSKSERNRIAENAIEQAFPLFSDISCRELVDTNALMNAEKTLLANEVLISKGKSGSSQKPSCVPWRDSAKSLTSFTSSKSARIRANRHRGKATRCIDALRSEDKSLGSKGLDNQTIAVCGCGRRVFGAYASENVDNAVKILADFIGEDEAAVIQYLNENGYAQLPFDAIMKVNDAVADNILDPKFVEGLSKVIFEYRGVITPKAQLIAEDSRRESRDMVPKSQKSVLTLWHKPSKRTSTDVLWVLNTPSNNSVLKRRLKLPKEGQDKTLHLS